MRETTTPRATGNEIGAERDKERRLDDQHGRKKKKQKKKTFKPSGRKNDRVATRTGTLGAGTRSERRATTSEDDTQRIKRASIFQVAKP
jgi:hypothetical protein